MPRRSISVLLCAMVMTSAAACAVPATGEEQPPITAAEIELVSRLDVPIGRQIAAVAHRDGYVFASGAGCGLQVIDVSDPAEPQLLGCPEGVGLNPGYIELAGDHAYVGGNALQVFDISALPEVTEVGRWRAEGSKGITGTPRDIEVVGHRGYVTTYHAGFFVLDLANPAEPEVIGHLDWGARVDELVVRGDHAFAAGSLPDQLRVIDIADPTRPREVARHDCGDMNLALAGDTLLAACRDVGLLDISKPSAPTMLGELPTPGLARGLAVVDGVAYIADRDYGRTPGALIVADISDPTAPRTLSSHPLGAPYDLAVADDLVFVADADRGLVTFRVRLTRGAAPAPQLRYLPVVGRGASLDGG